MTEEEIIAWLSQARSPIWRDGALSRDEVAVAVMAYLGNGLGLFYEALLLCRHDRVQRAAGLVVLGLEEIGKVLCFRYTWTRRQLYRPGLPSHVTCRVMAVISW